MSLYFLVTTEWFQSQTRARLRILPIDATNIRCRQLAGIVGWRSRSKRERGHGRAAPTKCVVQFGEIKGDGAMTSRPMRAGFLYCQNQVGAMQRGEKPARKIEPQIQCRPGLDPGAITTGLYLSRERFDLRFASKWHHAVWVPGQALDDSGECDAPQACCKQRAMWRRGMRRALLAKPRHVTPAYFRIGTPLVVNFCIRPSGRIGRRVPAALPVPGG